MITKKLGRTGLDISPLCLGSITYGVPEAGKWVKTGGAKIYVLDLKTLEPIFG